MLLVIFLVVLSKVASICYGKFIKWACQRLLQFAIGDFLVGLSKVASIQCFRLFPYWVCQSMLHFAIGNFLSSGLSKVTNNMQVF